jgi:hypothetical protein
MNYVYVFYFIFYNFMCTSSLWGPGVALLVRGYQDRSPVVWLEIFTEATDGTMCLGVDSASKNEYQKTPGGRDGRCVRVTTLRPS